MGGAIGFTVRDGSGVEHRMCRHTNNFPGFTDSVALAEKDPAHLDWWLEGWRTLCRWHREEPRKTKADWLVPYAGLNPVEYGLVVVDYQTNTVLDMNDYHAVGFMDIIAVSNDLVLAEEAAVGGRRRFNYKAVHDAEDFFKFVAADRIGRIHHHKWDPIDTSKDVVTVLDGKGRPPEYYLELIADRKAETRRGAESCWYRFEFDLHPFTVKSFEKTPEGAGRLKEAVLGLGFTLSADERTAWDEYVDNLSSGV